MGNRVSQKHIFWIYRANEGDKILVSNNATNLPEQKFPKPKILYNISAPLWKLQNISSPLPKTRLYFTGVKTAEAWGLSFTSIHKFENAMSYTSFPKYTFVVCATGRLHYTKYQAYLSSSFWNVSCTRTCTAAHNGILQPFTAIEPCISALLPSGLNLLSSKLYTQTIPHASIMIRQCCRCVPSWYSTDNVCGN